MPYREKSVARSRRYVDPAEAAGAFFQDKRKCHGHLETRDSGTHIKESGNLSIVSQQRSLAL